MGDDAAPMSSHRPYLLRALYEWIVDNGMTPHVLVDAGQPGVRVPAHAVKDGRIVLNIAERAVGGLRMDNDALRFSARFGGVSQSVLVPLPAVIAGLRTRNRARHGIAGGPAWCRGAVAGRTRQRVGGG